MKDEKTKLVNHEFDFYNDQSLMIENFRHEMPKRIAEQLVGVQPMTEPIDLDELAEAMATLHLMHGANCCMGLPVRKEDE